MTTTTTESRPMPQRIIRAIQTWTSTLESEYQEYQESRTERGPGEHLMGACIDKITALCRMLDEINKMDGLAVVKKQERRIAKLKTRFCDLVRDVDVIRDGDEDEVTIRSPK